VVSNFCVAQIRRSLFSRCKVDVISYRELTRLEVASERIVLIGNDGFRIEIPLPDRFDLAARINAVRCTLFDRSTLPYELVVDPAVAEVFNSCVFPYHSLSLTVDRFLASLPIEPEVTYADLDRIVDVLESVKRVFEIAPAMLTLSRLSAIAEALSFDRQLCELSVAKVAIAAAQSLLGPIIQRSTSITRFAFSGVKFDEQCAALSEVLRNSPGFAPSEWIFELCDFGAKSHFYLVFDAFEARQKPVSSLSFDRCEFIPASFERMTDSFLAFGCFHQLRNFSMRGVRLPHSVLSFLSVFLTADWLLKGKPLASLAITDCGIELDDVFQVMTTYETGIASLNFSGNRISSVPKNFASALTPVATLVLADCTFALERLSDILKALGNHQHRSVECDLRLDVSRASPDALQFFHEITPPWELPSLTRIVWDGNPIMPSTAQSFVDFIMKQPRLTSISISDCILASDFPRMVETLAPVFVNPRFTCLSIAASTPEFALGLTLAPLIERMGSRVLVSLNITGQQIGEAAVASIVQKIPSKMESFHFDNNGIREAKMLTRILSTVLKRAPAVLSWPAMDIESVMKSIPHDQRYSLNEEINGYQSQYNLMYTNAGKAQPAKESFLHPEVRIPPAAPPPAQSVPEEPEIGDTGGDLFHAHNEEIDQLMEQCGLAGLRDPMQVLYAKLQVDFGFQALADRLNAG
jgi:hypothetical protein